MTGKPSLTRRPRNARSACRRPGFIDIWPPLDGRQTCSLLHDGNRTIGPTSRRTGLGLPASSTATKVKVASVTFSR